MAPIAGGPNAPLDRRDSPNPRARDSSRLASSSEGRSGQSQAPGAIEFDFRVPEAKDLHELGLTPSFSLQSFLLKLILKLPSSKRKCEPYMEPSLRSILTKEPYKDLKQEYAPDTP